MDNVCCGNCHFYDKNNQVCNNPGRDDSAHVFYYGHHSPHDYCTLFMSKLGFVTGELCTESENVIAGGNDGKTKNTTE